MRDVKAAFVYYNLSSIYSFAYLSYVGGCGKDTQLGIVDMHKYQNFATVMTRAITNPSQQLSLCLYLAPTATTVTSSFLRQYRDILENVHAVLIPYWTKYMTVDESFCVIRKLPLFRVGRATRLDATLLQDVKLLHFEDCPTITTVVLPAGCVELCMKNSSITSAVGLAHLHKLDLSYSSQLTDVSNLRSFYYLNLSYCFSLSNLDGLSEIRKLNLSGCQSVVDVSPLGGVYNLCIDGCVQITDLRPLSHVIVLSVLYLENLKFGLVPNHMVRRLSVSAQSLELILNQSIKSPGCIEVHDSTCNTVSQVLGTCNAIHFFQSRMLDFVAGLSYLSMLRLSKCRKVAYVADLKALKCLVLEYTDSIPRICFQSLLSLVSLSMVRVRDSAFHASSYSLKNVLLTNCSINSISIYTHLPLREASFRVEVAGSRSLVSFPFSVKVDAHCEEYPYFYRL
jgi:hypothetical protein